MMMDMVSQPLFELIELSYSYDTSLIALDSINMTVHRGETLAILGSNGSGKSTLLKLLDGLYFPTSGKIRAFDRDLSEDQFHDAEFNTMFRSRVGFVFQESDVQLFMPTVADEISFGPLQMGLSEESVKDRVENALTSLHIEPLRDRAPFRLSGGEKKRVAIASILSISPEIWLMDEPTAGLDPRSTAWLKKFISSQKEDGKTIVLATHDLNLAQTCADRVYLLGEDHRLAGEGTTAEILENKSILVNSNLLSEDD
jgi:cobalt/nickel transport system ATP-binding protein